VRQRSNLIILFGIAFFLVGGAIVFLVLSDEDDGGGSDGGTANGEAAVAVLVAAADIPANTLGSDAIEQGLLTTEQVSVASQPVGALTSADALENKIFAVAVEEGTAVTATQLATRSLSNVQVPEGFDGVAVTIDYTNGGAGYVAPGDTVNVYGVFGNEGGDAGIAASGAELPLPRSELILTNVLVLDVSAQQGTSVQQAPAAQGQDATLGRQPLNTPLTYLLALRPTDVERVVQATSFADLYLSLTAENAPNVTDTPGVAGDTVTAPVSADSAAPRS
jgi:Flp pilus assembly protein CpaB